MLPDAGDIAWVEFDPVLGTEQAGRRPAVVLTNRGYHLRSRRALVCPITSKLGDWAFNVRLPPTLATRGMVLVDQARVVDREKRLFDIVEKVPPETLAEIRARLAALVGFEI